MKYKIIEFDFNKNSILKETRGIGFDDVIRLLSSGHLLDDILTGIK